MTTEELFLKYRILKVDVYFIRNENLEGRKESLTYSHAPGLSSNITCLVSFHSYLPHPAHHICHLHSTVHSVADSCLPSVLPMKEGA